MTYLTRVACVSLETPAVSYIATAEMGSIKMLETVTTPFWMYLYDKEVPSVTALVGGGLIIVAVVTCAPLTAHTPSRMPLWTY